MPPAFFKCLLFLTVGIASVWSGSAFAGLGADAASVLADAEELQGTVQSTPLPLYEIREVSNDSAMRVREFLTHEGTVFAVAWDGPLIPDLQSLLGASFEKFAASAAAQQRGVQKSLQVTFPDLVVESSGHMRAYSGRAYLPLLVPPGASAAELR